MVHSLSEIQEVVGVRNDGERRRWGGANNVDPVDITHLEATDKNHSRK